MTSPSSRRPANRFPEFAASIGALPEISRESLISETFRIDVEGDLAVYYAPFDHINEAARLVLVGITPGWSQMQAAHRIARDELRAGRDQDAASDAAKRAASFSGPMRSNLVAMLDDIDLADALGVTTTAELFASRSDLLHPTSAVRYPVFVGRNAGNYSGASPTLLESPLLRRYLVEVLCAELATVPNALVVPLGVAASRALATLTQDGVLDQRRLLSGFPHPSGLNGSRLQTFERNRASLARQVKDWFDAPGALRRRAVRSSSPNQRQRPAKPAGRHAGANGRSAALDEGALLPDSAWFVELAFRTIQALGGEITDRRTYYRKGTELGGFGPEQRAVPPPPRNRANLENKIEFELSFALSKLKQQGRLENPARGVWRIPSDSDGVVEVRSSRHPG